MDEPASHADILAIILAQGGTLVATFELDEHGRTEGAPVTQRRPYRCSGCGGQGHMVTQCNGAGKEPRARVGRHG